MGAEDTCLPLVSYSLPVVSTDARAASVSALSAGPFSHLPIASQQTMHTQLRYGCASIGVHTNTRFLQKPHFALDSAVGNVRIDRQLRCSVGIACANFTTTAPFSSGALEFSRASRASPHNYSDLLMPKPRMAQAMNAEACVCFSWLFFLRDADACAGAVGTVVAVF